MAYEGKANTLDIEKHSKMLAYLANTRHALRDTAIYLIGYRAGLRIGTIAQLRTRDLFDESGKIKQVSNLHSSIVKGKKKSYRAYFTHPELINALYAYKESKKDTEFFFTNQKGGPFSPNTAQKLMYNHFKAAGFEGMSSHSMRRSYATNCLRSGADIVMLKNLMNHSNIVITAEYIHTDDNTLMDIVANV